MQLAYLKPEKQVVKHQKKLLQADQKVHAAQEGEHDAAEGKAGDKVSEATHESGAEPAGVQDAASVPKENGEQKPTVVSPKRPAADTSKAVKKAPAAVKSSPVKTTKTTTGPTTLTKKVC